MDQSQLYNAEIKAYCKQPELIRKILLKENADFKGLDHQIDTYFEVGTGKLKLREGNIENSLIFYERREIKGIKESNIDLIRLSKEQIPGMKTLLSKLFKTKVVVDKQREIYFIDNVKFHIDKIIGLGDFVEIEAIQTEDQSPEFLRKQCLSYLSLFGLKEKNCIDRSYADMK